jgi:hypothetical protein
MATVKKGVLLWRGDAGRPEAHMGRSLIIGADDDTKLATFATAMEAHTKCNVAGRSFNSKTTGSMDAPGAGADVDVKATIYMKDPADDSTRHYSYPAPVDADFELKDVGERMTSVALTAIMADINTLLGLTGENVLVGLYGVKTKVS